MAGVFHRILEWFASRSSPRFRESREARLLLEGYLRDHRISPEEFTEQQREDARTDGTLAEVERLYLNATRLAREERAAYDEAVGLSQLGLLYNLCGRLEEAENVLRGALDILDDLPRRGNKGMACEAANHYVLAQIALARGDLREADARARRSLEIDEALGDVRGMSLDRRLLEKCSSSAGGER